MKVAVLGTGIVGRTLAGKLIELEHEVRMGSRDAANETAAAWAREAGENASHGTFADAAGFGEMVVNATGGMVSLQALEAAGQENLAGKVLVDVANALDFSKGRPPTLAVCNDDSLAEQIQRAHPDARVVKTLNTVNCEVMVQPSLVPGRHNVFVCGDDAGAKHLVTELLRSFGWPTDAVIDLGGIAAARATEMYLPLWLQLMGATGTPRINILVEKA